jgi:predicted ferric reductase
VTAHSLPAVRVRGESPLRLTAGDVVAAFVAGGIVVVGLWWRDGGLSGLGSSAAKLTSAGRGTGLLGAYLVLVQLLLVARLPPLERRFGLDRLTIWHRYNGRCAITLLVAHAILITLGYAAAARSSLLGEVRTLVLTVPGMLKAVAALILLLVVVGVSIRIARRRMRYETWYFVHLYSYLALALSFSHQLSSGRAFGSDQVARGFWYFLWGGTLAALLVFRVGAPLVRALMHRIRVESVVRDGPGIAVITMTGRRLDRLGALPGQFFVWRFLTKGRWHEAHPFSLSAAPDGRRLRITVKAVGDHTAGLMALKPGARVLAEGPYGAFTDERRSTARAVYVAGGIGITPIRAILETAPPGAATVIYRAINANDLVHRRELDEIAERRGVDVRYVLGDHRDPRNAGLMSAGHLRRLVPDLRRRDAFVCGPPAMADAAVRELRHAGVPGHRIHTERFAF